MISVPQLVTGRTFHDSLFPLKAIDYVQYQEQLPISSKNRGVGKVTGIKGIKGTGTKDGATSEIHLRRW